MFLYILHYVVICITLLILLDSTFTYLFTFRCLKEISHKVGQGKVLEHHNCKSNLLITEKPRSLKVQ